jgi:glycosyltransferase involved in cell wall biosynthesis
MTHRPEVTRPRPFFEATTSTSAVRGRLLLISYGFPPMQASGALRWQKLSRYVAERGWALDVITLDPACVQSPDHSRLADLAPGTRVYGVPTSTLWIQRAVLGAWKGYARLRSRHRATSKQGRVSRSVGAATASVAERRPASFARNDVRWDLHSPRSVIRAYHSWLDYAASGRWARDAAAVAERLIDPAIHRAIITSGPPHMAHEAGRRVSSKTGVPFIVDMRDAWSLTESLDEEIASPLWLRLAARHERRIVAQAALVVTNTIPFRQAMCTTYPEAADRVIVTMNGCDEDPVPASRPGGRFTIAYAGTIYLDRDPGVLFRAVAQLVTELGLTPADLGIEFIGEVGRYGSLSVTDIARATGLSDFVTIGPPRPHRAALEFLAQATMLVSLPQDHRMAIPAKVFEYLRFDAWVLVLATRDSATGALLRDSGADVVEPDDVEAIVSVLRKRFLEYRTGVRPTCIAKDGRFSRRGQAQILLDAIADVTARGRVTSAVSVPLQ